MVALATIPTAAIARFILSFISFWFLFSVSIRRRRSIMLRDCRLLSYRLLNTDARPACRLYPTKRRGTSSSCGIGILLRLCAFSYRQKWKRGRGTLNGLLPSVILLSLFVFAFHLFDSLEYAVHNLRNNRVAVCFQRFRSPLVRRNGKAVQRKGKPIISSTNWGASRKVPPASLWSQVVAGAGEIPCATIVSRFRFRLFRTAGHSSDAAVAESARGVGSAPILARSCNSIVQPCACFRCIRSLVAGQPSR